MTRKSFYVVQGWHIVSDKWDDIANRGGNAPYHEVKRTFNGLKSREIKSGYSKFRMVNREVRDTVQEESD